jgi:hypothetical protein
MADCQGEPDSRILSLLLDLSGDCHQEAGLGAAAVIYVDARVGAFAAAQNEFD